MMTSVGSETREVEHLLSWEQDEEEWLDQARKKALEEEQDGDGGLWRSIKRTGSILETRDIYQPLHQFSYHPNPSTSFTTLGPLG